MSDIPEINFTKTVIASNPRKLHANWAVDIQQDLTSMHGIEFGEPKVYDYEAV